METELIPNSNFRLFAVSRKQKRKTSVFCCKKKHKTKVVFLGRQTINGDRQLLFQQMCPTMPIVRSLIFMTSTTMLAVGALHRIFKASTLSIYMP